MQKPFWVADTRVDARRSKIFGNHTCSFDVEEGRTRPSNAYPHVTHQIRSLTALKTAKPASSQGEALGLNRYGHTHLQTTLKDMKMEFSS